MPNTLSRVILALLTFSALTVGLWALLAPESFYDDFPGGGRSWVSVDGPYNEHLVRDVGALNLALAVITIVALVRLAPTIVLVAAGAWLVWSIPHFIYHATHLDVYSSSDKVANMVSLGLAVIGPVVLVLLQSTSKVPPDRQ